MLTSPETWGPKKYGIDLIVDNETSLNDLGLCVSMDVEYNRGDGAFVGIGFYSGGKHVLHFSSLSHRVKKFIETRQFITHNGKSDLHKLKSWGVSVKSSQISFDTMIASYVTNSTKQSHSLKELARSELGIAYPSYEDFTGSGRKAIETNQIPLSLMAPYNSMDCIVTYRAFQKYNTEFTPQQRVYFNDIETPIFRLLYDMEERGIKVDIPYLKTLDIRFRSESNKLYKTLVQYCGTAFNPRSPKQVAERLFKKLGIQSAKTDKSVLQSFCSIPLIQSLLRFREVEKLRTTYTTPLIELGEKDNDYRIHTTFNQVAITGSGEFKGIRTGRLSSSEPNLHNIPTRTETGDLLRRAFTARANHVLVCADYSQIEWRLAAHFSKDKEMLRTIIANEDPYEKVAQKAKVSRRDAKTAMLAMNFGAGGYKVAFILNRPDNDGFNFVRAYEVTYPQYFQWRRKIERQPYVETILGRQIVPESDNLKVPYMIQGSAADIIKKAMLKLNESDLFPMLQIHDEILLEIETNKAEIVSTRVKEIMENVMKLDVPLVCEPGIGATWYAAKK